MGSVRVLSQKHAKAGTNTVPRSSYGSDRSVVYFWDMSTKEGIDEENRRCEFCEGNLKGN